MARGYIKRGGEYKSYGWSGGKFYKWRVYLNPETGWVSVSFIGKNNSKFSSPYSPDLKWSTVFDDPNEWNVLLAEIESEVAKQKKKFPEKYKEQKSDGLRKINFGLKYHKKWYNLPLMKEWIDQIIPELRKREKDLELLK